MDASVLKRYSKSRASTHGGGLVCHPYETGKAAGQGRVPKKEGMSFPDEEPEGAMTLCQSLVRAHETDKEREKSR
jgi:hypothetical protein